MSEKIDPNLENPILSQLTEKERAALPPEWLRPFLPWRDEPESERLPLTESGFTKEGEIRAEFSRLHSLRDSIRLENEKRLERGERPISFVGIHAAPEDHSPSRVVLDKMLSVPEWLGAETHGFEVGHGGVRETRLEEIRKAIQESDGVIVTTHTKRGILNQQMTALLEAIEDDNLRGKVAAFVHTYDDRERDSQLGPLVTVERFFRDKGAIIVPVTFFHGHTGASNEPWFERNFERTGVKILQFLERAAKSNIRELVKHPERTEQRKVGGKITKVWEGLREKVSLINAERGNRGQVPLNALIVLGGEHPRGFSTRTAKVLGKNFEYLGIRTDFFSLPESTIKPTTGNPLTVLSEELTEEAAKEPEKGSLADAYMRLLKADIVIFASPVRWMDVSGRLQQFIERTTPLEAQGYLLSGKAFGTILTFVETGAAEAEARLQEFAQYHGMMVIPSSGLRFTTGGYENVRPKVVQDPSKMKAIRRTAALGTALVADILAADGEEVKKIRWRTENPFLSMVGAKE